MSRSWAEIDLDAITDNVKTLRRSAPGAEVCAVVKADGYGHGVATVADAAIKAGATRLAVAQVAEGVALRNAGITAVDDVPIWVLSQPELHEFGAAAKARLEPAVYTSEAIDVAAEARRSHRSGQSPFTVHLKLDTGMHRVGAMPSDAIGLAGRVVAASGLRLGSVWTHMACADDLSDRGVSITNSQLDAYDDALAKLAQAGIDVGLRHTANSAALLAHPRSHFDVVRAGIALYGLDPGSQLGPRAGLRPVMSWKTTVGFVKQVKAGSALSYGHRMSVDQDCYVATLPVGYADGFRRRLWAVGGQVLIGGVARTIVGAVTMDQTIVDLGPDTTVQPGDEAVLIGTQGNEQLTADDMAQKLDTINYEITCSVGNRIERQPTP